MAATGRGSVSVCPHVGRARPTGYPGRSTLRSAAVRVPLSIAARDPEPDIHDRCAARACFACSRPGQHRRAVDFTNPMAAYCPEFGIQLRYLLARTTRHVAPGIGPDPDGLARDRHDPHGGRVGRGRVVRLRLAED